MKNYVGRKIRGFSFEDGTDGVKWFDDMDRHIGSVGKVYKQNDTIISVEFDNWYCDYPISLVENHLTYEGVANNLNNILIGINAGVNLTTENNIVIIGDNIKDLNKNQEEVYFLNDKVAIGKTIKGQPCNLYYILTNKNTAYGMESLTETTTGCNSQAFGSSSIKINDNQTPEIPQLGEGVLMEVSDDDVHWDDYNIIARLANGRFIDSEGNFWKLARPITQLPKYTHAELVEKIGEEFEYINK